MKKTILTLIGLCLLPFLGMAASSESFIIQQQIIGADTSAPSVPNNVTATALSYQQVQVSWQPSVDNVGVAGYVVYRDGVAVATTTNAVFHDTTVLPETTYSYTVVAFDAAGNYSPVSLPATVLTPAIPLPPVVPEGGGSLSLVPVELRGNVSVAAKVTTATVDFVTNLPVRYQFTYGLTSNADDFSVANSLYLTENRVNLDGLVAQSLYYYILTVVDVNGRTVELERGYFYTTGDTGISSPVNPNYFVATPQANLDVKLVWDNPYNYRVQLLRSNFFYPQNESEGLVIYEGYGNHFLDLKALKQHETVYYTLFFYNELGERSSGALAVVSRAGGQTTDPGKTPDTGGSKPDTGGSLPGGSAEGYLFPPLIRVAQNHATSSLVESPVALKTHSPYLFYINKTDLPTGIKTILLTLGDKNKSERTTYLLSLNEEGGRYEAYLPAVLSTARYEVKVALYDYSRRVVETVTAELHFSEVRQPTSYLGGWTWLKEQWLRGLATLGIFFLLALLFWWLLLWWRDEDEEDEEGSLEIT